MDKTDAAAGKRKKPSRTKRAMGISVAGKANFLPIGTGGSSSSPVSFQPQSPQSHAEALKPLRSSVRSLSYRCRRTEVVSCEDEESEVGRQSTPSSGGVWRNASWGYIKH